MRMGYFIRGADVFRWVARQAGPSVDIRIFSPVVGVDSIRLFLRHLIGVPTG